jgi:hypothetical protein
VSKQRQKKYPPTVSRLANPTGGIFLEKQWVSHFFPQAQPLPPEMTMVRMGRPVAKGITAATG